MNTYEQYLTSSNTKPLSAFDTFITALLAFSLALIGLSTYLIGSHKSLDFTAGFYGFDSLLANSTLSYLTALVFGIATVLSLMSWFQPMVKKGLGLLLILMSLLPLGTLLSDNVWIASLGGFPAIGSGQGIIKYFALLAIGLYLLSPQYISTKAMIWLNFMPVAVIYLWIGGMKFTLIEAKGIEPLVASSPLLSWMYNMFDLQMTSNLIGVYDLAVTALLGLSLWYKRFIIPALLLASTVFIVTQTFFFTWNNALSATTAISSGGQFLIKDIWFLLNLLVIYQLAVASK